MCSIRTGVRFETAPLSISQWDSFRELVDGWIVQQSFLALPIQDSGRLVLPYMATPCLCHSVGGELEQIQFLLGHVSVQTTEKYLGCKQRFREAVNDEIWIEPGP